MDEVEQVRCLTQAVSYSVAFRLKAIPKPRAVEECISLELAENLSKIVWVERYVFAADSAKFMRDHIDRMNSRGEVYIIYAIYLCYLAKECFKEGYEVFIRTLTLLLSLATYYPRDRFLEAIALSATIFSFFYSAEISNDFLKQGGFAKLNEYLLQRQTLDMYPDVEELEGESGKMRKNIFIQLNRETSRFKVKLSENFKASDIEAHWPSLQMLSDVLVSGSGSIMTMVSGVRMHLQPPTVSLETSSKNDEDSERPQTSELSNNKIEQTSQGQKSSTEISYRKVMKHIREFHTKCQKLELLLDLIFEET